jgi:hypothetical protein
VSGRLHGIVAEFSDAAALVAAARSLREAGVDGIEAYTPYPVEGLDRALGARRSRVPAIMLAAGLAGGAGGFLLQYVGMAFGYPLNIGGRPFNSWPAYLPSTYEIGAMAALIIGFCAFAAATRLLRLYDPVLDAPGFEGASQDRFLLCIDAGRAGFDRGLLEILLARAAAQRVAEILG